MATGQLLWTALVLAGSGVLPSTRIHDPRLEGIWVVVEAYEGGQPVEPMKGALFQFFGDSLTLVMKDGEVDQFELAVGRGGPIRALSVQDAPGSDPTIGLYEVDGPHLRIGFGDGNRWPAMIPPPDGQKGSFFILERHEPSSP